MRSPAKKQGLLTPSRDNRKYKLSKLAQKKSEKDPLKRNDIADRSPSHSPNMGLLRRSRLSRDSNEGSSRARSTSSGKSRNRSSSLTKVTDKQYNSPSSKEKKRVKDDDKGKRNRSIFKSKKKSKSKLLPLAKDSTANEEIEKSTDKSKVKRGRPPKQNPAKDNIARTIERVIAKYCSSISCSNVKKVDKGVFGCKKQGGNIVKPLKKLRYCSPPEDKSLDFHGVKKKRGRPVGSKNKKKLYTNEKSAVTKKLSSDHSRVGRHLSESSYEEDSPPFKKFKMNAKDDELKSKAKLKPKKSSVRKIKVRNSSLKNGMGIAKVKSSIVKSKIAKKVTTGFKRGVGRPKKSLHKAPSKLIRKSQKQKEQVDSSEDIGDTHKHKASTKFTSRSPSRESEKFGKEKLMLPIKKKYKKEYFSESENTSGREDDEKHVPIIKNPKKAFRDKWKRELKQKSKAEKNKLMDKLVNSAENDKLPRRREHKPRAVTFDFGKTYDFTDSEDEADKDTDSEHEAIPQTTPQRKKGTKKKKSHLEVAPLRRTARMASLNAIAMMHCMNEDAKVSFSSSHTKDELPVAPRKESTIARRHSDSDSEDSDSDGSHREKPPRGRPPKKSKEKTVANPPKKRKRRRNELGVTMDIREMVVQKRMASLNASAIMAASYSLESRSRRVPTSNSSENEATDIDIKQKISYKATKEANVKTRSVITVQETTKKVKKAQGRKEAQVEERIIFQKKVNRHTGVDSTDTDKEDNITDASENDSELLSKTPDSGLMIESTITYVTTQTLTMPKSALGNNNYSLSSPNSKLDMVQHVSQKSSSSTVSLPHIQPNPQPTHSGQENVTSNQHSFIPAQKYSPLGALSEMHPILHPHLPHPHPHTITFPPQHHMLPPPPQQHPVVAPYHHLGSHHIPPQAGPLHPVASVSHHALPYPPLSPHSPPYPPPSKSTSNSPAASSSPSSTPNSYFSSQRASPYSAPISQSSPSSSPKGSASLIVPISSPPKVPSIEDHRQIPANRSHGGISSCERHHSAFTAPTPSALSPVSSSHGYQPVSGPMPTGNTTVSSTYKPQQGPPISSYSPSTSPRVAKPYKTDFHTVPSYPPYHGHPYPYDKYMRGAPYQFYQHHYPPGAQFGAQGENNYPLPPPGAMHCSQEYAYTLCIPGPPNHPPYPPHPHQPLALPPTSSPSSSTPSNAVPQYYQYPEYPPVFTAYPSPGPPGQNAICYPTSKYRPPAQPIGGGKGPDTENNPWASPAPYNYQYYNPPNNHSIHPYQHPSINETNQSDKSIIQKKLNPRDCTKQRSEASLDVVDRQLESAPSNIISIPSAADVSKHSAHSVIPSNTTDDAKQNGIESNCQPDDTKLDALKTCLPTTSSASANIKKLEKHTNPSAVSCAPANSLGCKDPIINVVDTAETRNEAYKTSQINHIVPLPSASNNSDVVPTVQKSTHNDGMLQSVPWLVSTVDQSEISSSKQTSNLPSKPSCSIISTSTTATIGLSSSEAPNCNKVKSLVKPVFTSAGIKNRAQQQNDSTVTDGSSCSANSDMYGSSSSQSEKSVSPGLDNIKEARKSDQRSGMRHLLCQSQPLSHSKSTSVLVKAKPSNFVSAKSVANASNKESLEKSNNFTSSGPKNCYARSSEISTESTAERTSVGKKEGRNLTQPRKRGRPPKSKTNPQITAGDVSSTNEYGLLFQLTESQIGVSSHTGNQQVSSSVDQNLNSVGSESVIIKGTDSNVLKVESVKLEGIFNKHGGKMANNLIKSVNGGFSKVENPGECDSKQNFTPISNEQLLERMNNMKQEDDNLPLPTSEGMEDPQIMEAVQKLSGDNFLSKQRKFRQKTGKVGRPTKKALVDKVRRKNVSLLSYLKEKNHESDTSIDESRGVNETEGSPPEKNLSPMKHSLMPFPSVQLQRKRRSSGLMKNKITKKPKYTHGWSWQGEANDGKVWLRNDENLFPRKCYTAMKHKLGDCLRVRDCVLLRSGTRRTDLPYVAKIAAFWEDPDTSDMMMSILWYYRPEHTDYGRRADDLTDEIFASKHRDHLSVACIDDRCYVLTYNEYCRYRRQLRLFQMRVSPSSSPVPQGDEEYLRLKRQPNGCVVQDLLFVCKRVYDYRLRRFLKNPC